MKFFADNADYRLARRGVLGLAVAPLIAQASIDSTELPSPLPSFDARDWAKSFVAHVQRNPSIPLDEDCMLGWFANAIMRGYDERESHLRIAATEAGKTATEYLVTQEIRGAVARGWCADENRYKEMDAKLAEAIVTEIDKLGNYIHDFPLTGGQSSTRIGLWRS